MSEYDDALYYDEGPEPEHEPDARVADARDAVLDLFAAEPDEVMYMRQIEVLLEKSFFHWITSTALSQLVAEGPIESRTVALSRTVRSTSPEPAQDETRIRFFWTKKNRYWVRRADEVRRLVLTFSGTAFGRALGVHGEQMFDAALPRGGFLPDGVNVRAYKGQEWTKTDHTLDRVFVRNGIAYGAEIKNALDYIERDELKVKIELCHALGLRPLFIVRMAPASYIETVRLAGGFTLVFKYQLYPHGNEELARKVGQELGLPVGCPVAIDEGTVQRLLTWHRKTHGVA